MGGLNIRASEQKYSLVELRPGEIHVARTPTFITTLLGSCVSVCLYSVHGHVGAMSHSTLPGSLGYGRTDDIKYVETAIKSMLGELKGLGVRESDLRAKLFGGAEMFRMADREIRLARIVGDGNTGAARDFLRARGINIVSECVGGNSGRKLVFNTVTGVVFVRKVGAGSANSHNGPFGEHAA